MRMRAYMLSCHERALVRRETIERLRATDWGEPPEVVLDPAPCERPQERQSRNARSLLARALADAPDVLLFLEDDLEFNAHLRSNLEAWAPLAAAPREGHFFGSLYNPGIREIRREPAAAFFVADPNAVYGSQAFVLSLATARHIERRWDDIAGMQDIKMSRLAGLLGSIHYHAPSLVQHMPVPSVWGGGYHSARDFDREWTAPGVRHTNGARSNGSLDRQALLRRMQPIEGWLHDDEANLLITVAAEALERRAGDDSAALVEVGSFCGRSTVVLGLTIQAAESTGARLYAVDPHDGTLTTLQQDVMQAAPTLDRFTRNIADAGLGEIVVPIVARAADVPWSRRIALLFVDGLHGYDDVAADFRHFDRWIQRGGFVAFHDYAHYFPGVKRFVDELLADAAYRLAHLAGSLIVLEKTRD